MLAQEQRTEAAIRLMLDFAQRTGLTSERIKQRYLWTDAFAVCNFLGLAQATSERRYADLALGLVDQVHQVLGRHRDDDPRRGWISGLPEQDGEAHPTRGGLRIGKKLPERAPDAPFDEQLEWERDGQYFHYLTRWMHALDQVARSMRQAQFNLWARELAQAAHHGFTRSAPAEADRRMVWKMSIDLTRPLVSSMGHHDPLDGLVTCAQLRTTASMLPSTPSGPSLQLETADFTAMTAGRDWVTADPLGLGGLLSDACRVARLMTHGAFSDGELLESLLEAALAGLSHYVRQGGLYRSASQRLAFRELGLAIGLDAIALIQHELLAQPHAACGAQLRASLDALGPYVAVGAGIELFWLDPEHRRTRAWLEHRDINDVMLATRLVPAGYLPAPARERAA